MMSKEKGVDMLNQALAVDHLTNRVLLVEPGLGQRFSIGNKLSQLDGYMIEAISKLSIAPALVKVSSPDLIVISVESLGDVDLQPLQEIKRESPLPVVVFAQNHADGAAKAAVAAGVTSYIVDDVSNERMPVIFDIAVERFLQEQTLNTELETTKRKLDDRKLIEKAKGIVMEQKSLSEEMAYREIRRAAMNQGRSMVELSQKIISLTELIGE